MSPSPKTPLLLRCAELASGRTARWSAALRATGDRNVFNPSIARFEGAEHVAYRAYGPEGGKPFHAYLLGENGRERQDLTAHARAHGVEVTADPKLVVLGDGLYVTFNTGYSETRNELYLMRLRPTLGPPQRCVLEQRQRVEKNWGFAAGEHGLLAIYSLAPLVLLRLRRGELGAGELEFAPVSDGHGGQPLRGLTLGTQPVARGDDLLVVAHEKVHLRRRRGYFGRPVTVRGGDRVEVGRTRLIHDLRALVPLRAAERHNPNLLFATYFAGAVADGPRMCLSYGVNDRAFGFAETPASLWP